MAVAVCNLAELLVPRLGDSSGAYVGRGGAPIEYHALAARVAVCAALHEAGRAAAPEGEA